MITIKQRKYFIAGVHDGIPICLGYIAVAFTFGIMSSNAGVPIGSSLLMSLMTLTGTGQFAGISLIAASASYFEMIATQFIINLRYCLMSTAISQKLDLRISFIQRLLISYGVTDEIFGMAISKKERLTPIYMYGLIGISVVGWVFGTFLGALSGEILPPRVVSALSLAIYGMFVAIIIPPCRDQLRLRVIVAISMVMSCIFTYAPFLRAISSGFRIIILTLAIAGAAAVMFPVSEADTGWENLEEDRLGK